MVSIKDVLTLRIFITSFLAAFVFFNYVGNITWSITLIYLPFIGLFLQKFRYASYIFISRMLLPITIGIWAVYIWELIHSSSDLNFVFRNSIRDFAVVQNLFEVLSTLYAICVAFLLWKGLTDYDNLRNAMRQEAGTIQGITEFFHYMDRDGPNGIIIDDIRDIFIVYLKNLRLGKRLVASQMNERLLKQIIGKVAKIIPEDDNDKIALTEVIRELSALSHLRTQRASYADARISWYLLSLVLGMSLFLLFPFFLRNPEESYIVGLLIFSLTTFLSFLFLTLLDMNDPFDGYYKVKVEIMDEVIQFLEDDKRDYNHITISELSRE